MILGSHPPHCPYVRELEFHTPDVFSNEASVTVLNTPSGSLICRVHNHIRVHLIEPNRQYKSGEGPTALR